MDNLLENRVAASADPKSGPVERRGQQGPTNIYADRTGVDGRVSLHCDYDGARYHIWVDPKTLEIDKGFRRPCPTLYKNAPLGTKPKDMGYYEPHLLDATAKANAPIVAAMLQQASSGTYRNGRYTFNGRRMSKTSFNPH